LELTKGHKRLVHSADEDKRRKVKD